jgi:hypothetical protein
MLTQKRLKELLYYNPETGEFTYLKKTSPSSHIKIGRVAGALHPNGYISIRLDTKRYWAHRLAWLYIYGEWPKFQIDHLNGIHNDNRIYRNLRDVSIRENCCNRLKHRQGKLAGCYFHKRERKWIAQHWSNGKNHRIGRFDTEQEAHNTYIKFITENVKVNEQDVDKNVVE